MIVGQNPGVEEDETGIPFIGKSGQLLDTWLNKANIEREKCWITNVCKCHSPNNRVPNKDELSACMQLLKIEIELVDPYIIIALGKASLSALINNFDNFRLGDYIFDYTDSYILRRRAYAVYHPSYVLRKHGEERDSIDTKIVEFFKYANRVSIIEERSKTV